MIPRPDLLDEQSPAGIEVFQLTSETAVPSCHVYMEAQVFTPDSRRLVFFNSDESGLLQAYMIRGLENIGADRDA